MPAILHHGASIIAGTSQVSQLYTLKRLKKLNFDQDYEIDHDSEAEDGFKKAANKFYEVLDLIRPSFLQMSDMFYEGS